MAFPFAQQTLQQRTQMIQYKNSRPSRALRVVTLFDTKEPSSDLLDSSKENNEKQFRKYYGKRVTMLTSAGKSVIPSNRFKLVKSFVARGSKLNRCPSKSINKLEIDCSKMLLIDNLGMSLLTSISQFKNLKDLTLRLNKLNSPLQEAALLKRVKKLRYIQSLKIEVEQLQDLRIAKYLLDLKRIKIMKIQISENPSRLLNRANQRYQYEFLDIYSKLLRSKTLQFLELIIQNVYTETLIDSLIRALKRTLLPAFHITLQVLADIKLDPIYLNAALNNLDLFTVCTQQVGKYSCGTRNECNMSLDQTKRRLTLQLSLKQKSVVRDPWGYDTLQERLEPLNDINEVLMIPFSPLPVHEVNIFNNKLKSIALDMNKLKCSPLSVEKLVKITKESCYLEHLELKGVTVFGEQKFDKDLLTLFFTGISNLTNLRSLEMSQFTLTPDLVSIMTYSLPFLKDLRKLILDLSLGKESVDDVPFSLNLPESSQLTELILTVPMISADSRINIMASISKLSHLRKLSIINGSQFFAETKLRKIFIDALDSLAELREVFVGERSEGILRFPCDEETAAELNELASSLMKKNLYLESVHFERIDTYEVSYQRP